MGTVAPGSGTFVPFDPGSPGGMGGAETGALCDRAVKGHAWVRSMALYAAAAAVLAGVESRQGSLKGLVYGSSFQVAGYGVRSSDPGGEPGGGLPRPGPRLIWVLSAARRT